MKKLIVYLLLLLLALGASSALAAEPGPAVVIDDAFCNLLAADGTVFITSGAHIVISNDKNGNVSYVCHAEQPPIFADPSRTVHFDFDNTGGLCGTGEGLTEDWKSLVTPSGHVTMVCHINPNPTP